MHRLTWYGQAVLDLILDLLSYMLVGFLAAGIVEEFVPQRRPLKCFGANDLLSLLRAAGAGFLVSACSCGAIPLAASLRNRGASTATTLTFLLASPWLGIPMLLVYVRFLGGPRTLGLVALSISVAIAAGMILAWMERRGRIAQGRRYASANPAEPGALTDRRCNEDAAQPDDARARSPLAFVRRVLARVPRHAWMLGKDIALYLLIGVFIAALPKAFVKPETVAAYLGSAAGPGAVLIVIPISVAIEACSEGFAVVAGQLYRQGASLAVVFVMTMVGVATDVTELTVLWKKFARRTTLTYLIVGACLTVLAGLVLQHALRGTQVSSGG